MVQNIESDYFCVELFLFCFACVRSACFFIWASPRLTVASLENVVLCCYEMCCVVWCCVVLCCVGCDVLCCVLTVLMWRGVVWCVVLCRFVVLCDVPNSGDNLTADLNTQKSPTVAHLKSQCTPRLLIVSRCGQ